MSANPVAKIQIVDRVELRVANYCLRNKQLNFCTSIFDRDEYQFSLVALEHDASSDRGDCFGFRASLKRGKNFTQLTECVRAIKTIGIRV